MEDTLLISDHVFVNREQFPKTNWVGRCFLRDIKRGDIVVFLSRGPGLTCERIMGIQDRIHRMALSTATAKS